MLTTMKQRSSLARTVMILFAIVLAMTMRAEDAKIIVWLNNGTKTEVLFDDMPEFVYQDGNVSLKSSTTELVWPLAQLQKFTFKAADPVPTGVKTVPTANKLDLAKGGAVYDMNGRLVKKHVKSLSELPAGTYIVKNGNVTTKVIRK